MKKILTKLAALLIVSIILTGNIALAGEAGPAASGGDSTLELAGAIDDAKANPCIKIPGGDEGYIITVIEEPLLIGGSEPRTDEEGNTVFATRICFRNTFSFTRNGREEVLTALSAICSETGFQKYSENVSKPELNVSFNCQEVQVLLSKGGTYLIEGYIGTIYRWAAGVVGIIAVLVIIISGVQIALGGGDTEAVSSAKGRIVKSLVGLAVLFLSGLILNTINPNFFT